jgi:hypothetical protein
MATDKKSFILYCDTQDLINQLPDEVAGKLFKHIFAYVNDENPQSDDILLNVAFAPIKAQLKRDLKSYESKRKERSRSGILGNLKKYHKDLYDRVVSDDLTIDEAQNIAKSRIATQSDTNLADNDSVNGNDNDSDNDILLKKETKTKRFNFKNELIALGVNETIALDWLKVRNNKKATNSKTAFEGLITQIEKSGLSANECIKIATERSWAGFNAKWIKENNEKESDNFSISKIEV